MATRPNKKTTNRNRTQKDDILELLYCDICNGLPRFQIQKKLENDCYEGYTTSTLCKSSKAAYIKEAYDMCAVEKQEEKDKLRDIMYNRLLGVYNACIEAHDHTNAINSAKELNKLMGLYEPDKKQIDATVEQTITLDFGFGYDDKDESETN